MSFRRILVATDFGAPADHAARLAAALAQKLEAELALLHVLEPPPPDADVDLPRAEARAALDDAAAKLRALFPRAQVAFRTGSPPEQILLAAKEQGADLIVTGTHGRHGLPRALLGSVAEKVVRGATVPVISVHAGAAAAPKHVLVATDFGPSSQRAVDTAIDLATRFGATLTVVHVVEPAAHVQPLAVREEMVEFGRRALEDAMRAVRARIPASSILREGTPWKEICEIAESDGADMIVTGSIGRRGIAHALLGSTAERVVRQSPVPVLVAHGFWFEDRGQAGAALARELSSLRAGSPAVVAISRGGVLVGHEVARELGVRLDVLLTRPVRHGGETLGAVVAGGGTRLDLAAVANVPVVRREVLVEAARAALADDLASCGAPRELRDLWRRRVAIVTDAIDEPWTVLAAADVVAHQRPERIVVAAPVGSSDAVQTLRAELHEVVVLHELGPRIDAGAAYHRFRPPNDGSLADLLRA